MFEGLTEDQLKGAIEALLFVSDEPVGVITLSDMLEVDPPVAEAALYELKNEFDSSSRGICLMQVAGGWRLFTKGEYHRLLERYVLSWDTRKLSQAALETLAIVAYGQPITRSGISTVRGVNSDSSLNSLIDKGLVREAGVSEAPGNPVLYATSKTFLEKFGLASTKDLPPLEGFAPDKETASFLRQSLKGSARFEDDELDSDFGEPVDDFSNESDVSSADTFGSSDDESRDADALRDELMRSMMADALAQGAGLVEKIDFDKLEFEE